MLKNVCHITSVHNRYDERIFLKECTSLTNAGYDVTLLVADNKPDEIANGVKITSVDFHPKNRMERITKAPKIALRRALEINADIYHLHDPELLTIALQLKKHGKKVVFDSHENVADSIKEKDWIPFFLRNIVSYLYTLYTNYVLKRLDILISVTPHIISMLKRINNNVVMITNYPIIAESQNAALQKGASVNIFVFAGGISEQWNHITILDALNQVNAKYLLIGFGNKTYMNKLKEHSVWDKKVCFKGKIPHQQVANMISQSTAGLAMLNYNRNAGGKLGTLGNTKLFECMQAGTPVICTDFILWKEIIDKWHCGICVSPRNVNALREAMQYLIDHPEEAQQMGENGRRAVLEEFNWGIEEKKLLALYKNLINREEN